MIDYTYSDLYYENSINKQLNIEAEDGTVITNTNIYQESMSLDESLCSEESLTFGCCEASAFKIKIANQFTSLYGQKLTVTETLDGNTDEPFQFGIYKVVEDTPTADRIYRNITAYDAMYDIINADASAVAEWYNTILPNDTSTVTLKEFRTSFLELFGIEQEDVSLVNDDMTIEKTISVNTLSGKTVICAICEINGCFGHIGRDGKFQYVHLNKISEDDGNSSILGIMVLDQAILGYDGGTSVDQTVLSTNYISCDYEDFITAEIDKLQIRQEENDVGCTCGDGDNCYIVEDNFLVYGKGTEELTTITENLYEVIRGITYRPVKTATVVGNPCMMLGDSISLLTKYQTVTTYILKRTLSGIQKLTDTYAANGVETYSNSGNSLAEEITQIKGKANTLERTIEETKSQLSDIEQNLTSTFMQTAGSILEEVAGAQITWCTDGLEYTIGKTYYGSPDDAGLDAAEYAEIYYLDQSTGYVYYSDGEKWTCVESLEVAYEVAIQSSLALEIAHDDSGVAYARLSANANYIGFESKQFVITSDQFSIDADGNASFSGELSAASGTFSGTVTTESGSYKAELGSGKLRLYYDGTMYATFMSTYWLSSTSNRGAALRAESAASYISFEQDANSDGQATAYYVINLGINPDSYTERHILYGNTRITGNLYFSSGDYYLNSLKTDGEYSGVYCSGKFATAGSVAVGNKTYAFDSVACMLNVYGYSFFDGEAYCSGLFSTGGKVLIGNVNYGDYMLNVNGNSCLNGTLRASNTITSTAANGFWLGYGSYGTILRNDGSDFYILLTDSGGTTWNSLRPFAINLASGAVSIGTAFTVSGYAYFTGVVGANTSADYAMLSANDRQLRYSSSSSERYKIVYDELTESDILPLYDIPTYWFEYKDGYLAEDDERYGKAMPGFIAERWDEVLPIAVNHKDGLAEMWNNNIVVPLTFEMVKHNHNEIEELKAQIAELQAQIAVLQASAA